MPTRSGLRAQKNRAAKQAFFDAAMELFKENGFDGTSVDEIADRAGFSRATYFNHFGTKQGVLRFYGQRLQEQVEASLTKIDSKASALDRIREVLLTMAREADAHSDELKLVYIYSQHDVEYLTKPTRARLRVFELMEELVSEAQRDGQVRTDLRARELAFHILAVYQGAITASVAGYTKVEPVMDTGWSFLLDGVRGGHSLAK